MTQEEDLICDAVAEVDPEAAKRSSSMTTSLSCLKGCMKSCCPLMRSALNDLRRAKVTEVVAKKAVEVLPDVEAQLPTVIDREDEIRKPLRDQYSYRYLELKNGLKVILASDPTSKTSAAALDIKVGSFHDPFHLQGLAHLCEHVLFTGSELYPNESYSSFLGQRGGTSNAYTTSEHTNFHFEVPSQHFEASLKRFVSFFQCPILREASIQNELEIIQSEHEKNKWNDVWRTNQVERATANPGHVFSHFSTGTRQTLTVEKGADRSLRYELFQFYMANYSANIMCLCLVHNDSLDAMEELAKAYLQGLLNKNVPERIWPSKPFKPRQMRTKIYIVPVKEVCHVNLTFPMEDISAFYSAAPAGQVAQLIGHKGQGGLYAYLRGKSWAHQLVASHKTLGKGFSLFMISVQLTDSGEKVVDEVIKHVFQYIKLLRDTGPLQWFYEELKYMTEQQFEHQDKERPQNFASNLALWLHLYPAKEVVAADYLMYEWRPDLIERIFAYLSPDNLRVTILTKKAKFFSSSVEPHFGTDYHVEKIPSDALASWHDCGINEEMRVPRPNDLIDRDPQILSSDSSRENAMPELFMNMDRIRLRAWYLPYTRPKIPKAFVFVRFFADSKKSCCPKTACLNSLFSFMIRDYFTDESYHAQIAGLFYVLRPIRNGMELEIRGSSGKQAKFLKKILSVIFEAPFERDILSKERFQQIHTLHLNGLLSGEASKLKILAKNILSHVLCPDSNHLRESRMEAMKSISVEDLRNYVKEFLLIQSIEAFFYGNVSIESANKMANSVIFIRSRYLEKYLTKDIGENLNVDDQLLLEDWFKNDPVHKIARLESQIHEKLAELPKNGDVIQPDAENENEAKPEEQIEVEVTLEEDTGDFALEYSLPKPDELGPRHDIIIVNNEVHSSSCVLYYLEYAHNRAPEAAKLELFFHLVQVKLVAAMKHVVPLGYVVGCDIRKVNDRLGFRITVESQYPLMVIFKTIEDALEGLDDFLARMSESEFEMSKAAVMSVKDESIASMTDKAHSNWREILDETYDFARHCRELASMSHLELLDIRTFYRQWIHSKACERRSLVISISPDPILNRLEAGPNIFHWTLRQIDKDFRSLMTPLPKHKTPQEWYQRVFSNSQNIYEPPFIYFDGIL